MRSVGRLLINGHHTQTAAALAVGGGKNLFSLLLAVLFGSDFAFLIHTQILKLQIIV